MANVMERVTNGGERMQPEIMSIEAGYRRLLISLEKEGYKINSVMPINMSRYIIIKGSLNGEAHNILISYKREFFFNFGIMFREQGYKGMGDSYNVEDLKIAVRNEVKELFSIFPNGKAYSILLSDFLNNSVKWQNKEGKEIRSVSIHLFKEVRKV